MVIIVVDSILWTSKTRKMTPLEVITTLEGKFLRECLGNAAFENCSITL